MAVIPARRPGSTTEATIMKHSAKREDVRREWLAGMPSWYNPWLHLTIPAVVGGAIIAACVVALDPLRGWHLVTIPASYVFANMNEWLAHRNLLHRRTRLAAPLYDRHTPRHHRVFVTDDMAIRDSREFGMVLIPAFGVLVLFAAVTAPAAILWLVLGHNVALLFVITAVAYALSYEWLHLSYHLPEHHLIARNRVIRALRHHHALHHDPRLMTRYNFNVTVPLWDWVRGTIAPRS